MGDIGKIIGGFVALILVIVGLFVGWKNMKVWSYAQDGKAILARAENEKKARVMEAEAKKASATLEGEAELTRATFAAKANKALAEGLGGSDNYLRYMYIRMLEESGGAGQVIYIPTEGGMPILEAGKR